jgi:hypothetical protein
MQPHFQPGGKMARLAPLYEAAETFLYSPGEVTTGSLHVRDAMDLKRIMIIVVVALIPCFYMAMWNTGYQANSAMALTGTQLDGWRGALLVLFGYGADPQSLVDNLLMGAVWFLPVYLVTNIVGGLWEVLFAVVRKHEINEGFLVTGSLFPLTAPSRSEAGTRGNPSSIPRNSSRSSWYKCATSPCRRAVDSAARSEAARVASPARRRCTGWPATGTGSDSTSDVVTCPPMSRRTTVLST